MGFSGSNPIGTEIENNNHDNLPVSIDWKIAGKVSRVVNQAECASDYAFAAVGAIESAYMI